MTPWDVMPDYDYLRTRHRERILDAAEAREDARREHQDEVADGLLSDPDFDPHFDPFEEDTC